MPGGIYINQDGGNHYSYAKLDYAAEDAEYKSAGVAVGQRVPVAGQFGGRVGGRIWRRRVGADPDRLPRHGPATGAQHDRGARDPPARRRQNANWNGSISGFDTDDEAMTERRLRQGNLIGPAGYIAMEDGCIGGLRAASAAIQRRGRRARDDGRPRGGVATVPRQRGRHPRLLETLSLADGRLTVDDLALRLGVHELIGDYAERIDEDRLEEWPDLFAEPLPLSRDQPFQPRGRDAAGRDVRGDEGDAARSRLRHPARQPVRAAPISSRHRSDPRERGQRRLSSSCTRTSSWRGSCTMA